jgi:hypothetical protein
MKHSEFRLRETSSNDSSSHVFAPRKRFDPTQLFAQRDRLPWVWFFVASLFPWRPRSTVTISSIDPAQTYYVSPPLQFSEGKGLTRATGRTRAGYIPST